MPRVSPYHHGHGSTLRTPDPDACLAAILILLHGLAEEQRRHAVNFLLDDLERLYYAARCRPPHWINLLRVPYVVER